MSEATMPKDLLNFKATEYHTQQVRDLAWVVLGQPIMTIDNHTQCRLSDAQWLYHLDQYPQPLLQHLQTKNLKMLGTYFEALWEFFLEQHPDFELKYKNLQVFAEQSTIGEFDFIFLDKRQNQYQHLEVAVKYYLGVIDEPLHIKEPTRCSLMSQWIGPGTRDRLDLKYQKLTQKQSRLAYTEAGQQLLIDKGIHQIGSQINLLGYLFYPMGLSIASPENVHPKHLRGFWLKLSELGKLSGIKNLWAIIDKPHWFAPVTFDRENLLNYNQLSIVVSSHFEQYQRPLLLAKFAQDEPTLKLTSHEFGFVVSDSWPQSR